jgi:16S rRNA processing protein RimM
MSDTGQARQPGHIEEPAGSPDPGEPVFLVVGTLRRPHGLRGELLMEVITDFPERLRPGVTVYLSEQYHPVRIRSRRWHGQLLLIAFEGYADPETAGSLRNHLVFVRADDRPPLAEGEYYHHQLLGLQVLSNEGETLGRLIQILETGANDVYVVRPQAGPDLLLPAIEPVITQVDLEQGLIRVNLLPGLMPE